MGAWKGVGGRLGPEGWNWARWKKGMEHGEGMLYTEDGEGWGPWMEVR